jgi:hypothetical protein
MARNLLKKQSARTEDEVSCWLTVPPPPTFPERCLPLRQQPTERPFSSASRNVDPVSHDWVFLLFKDAFHIHSRKICLNDVRCHRTKFVTLGVTVSVFLRQKLSLIEHPDRILNQTEKIFFVRRTLVCRPCRRTSLTMTPSAGFGQKLL